MTTTTDKVTLYVEGHALNGPTECFAIPGQTMIDVINPVSGKTAIYGKTLEECRTEKGYEQAERMTIEAYCQGKAIAQTPPVTWETITENKYWEMYECLPPIHVAGRGFMVSEPWDHHALTGTPMYGAYRKRGEVYEASTRPMTVKEWKDMPL